MKIDIVKIGNSQGVRLPKAILEQCGFGKEALLEVRDGEVVLRPTERRPREGWAKAFAAAREDAGSPDTGLLEFENDFDATEWTWPCLDRKTASDK